MKNIVKNKAVLQFGLAAVGVLGAVNCVYVGLNVDKPTLQAAMIFGAICNAGLAVSSAMLGIHHIKEQRVKGQSFNP